MYRSKTIYEKKFPRLDISEIKRLEKEVAKESSTEEETEHLTFEEIIQRIYKDMIYAVMPGRKEKALAFMRKAVAISELYEMTIKIEEHLSHVCVTYYFDCSGGMKRLIDIIKDADDISFFNQIDGYEIVMSLDFYTHTEYRHGRQMNP